MEKKELKSTLIYKTLLWTATPLLVLYIVYTVWVFSLYDIIDSSNVGSFVDSFGAINALFTGLAFLGAVIAVVYQARELKEAQKQVRLQTDALELQTKELADTRVEVKLQTVALRRQELEMKSNRLEQELSRGLSLVMQHVQIIRGLKSDDVAIFANDCLEIGDYLQVLNLSKEEKVSTKALHQKFPRISTSDEFEAVASTFKSFFATFNALGLLHLDNDNLSLSEAITRLRQMELLFETARAHIPMDIDTAVGKLSFLSRQD
jgi:hypothetical protein